MPAVPRPSFARSNSKHFGADPKQEQLDQQQRRKLTNDTKSDFTRFAEADADGNQRLDFEEFYSMQSQYIRDNFSSTDIRSWFDAADDDGDVERSGVRRINLSAFPSLDLANLNARCSPVSVTSLRTPCNL